MASSSSPPSPTQILLGKTSLATDALFIPNSLDKPDYYGPFVVAKDYVDSTPASVSPTSQYDDPLLSHEAHPSSILLDNEAYFRLSDYLAQSPDALESQASLDEEEDHKKLVTKASAPTPAAVASATTDNLQIRVIGAPEKSRVETQTRLCIQLVTANGTKVTHYPYLKLPERLLARSRLKRAVQCSSSFPPEEASSSGSNANPTTPTSNILYLDANVICASHPEQPVKVCQGCIQRERKRAERSKNDHRLRIDNFPEQDRILLFNCGPVVNFSSGDAILPTRIACYCRHHNEKVGFSIQFSLKNDKGDVVAVGTSPPILITDDHKSSRQKGQKRARADSEDGGSTPPSSLCEKHRLVTPANSRRGSLSPTSGKQEEAASSRLLLFDHSPLPLSPSLPTPAEERRSSSLFGGDMVHPLGSVLPPLTPPSSASSCISPDALTSRNHPQGNNLSQQGAPQLERLIPAQGPTYGGVEITVLGSGFYSGLTCVFGEHQATTVYWSPNTLVCVLPPTATPGPVVVSFKEHSLVLGGQGVPLFTYYNANEQALMELALQVVGLKMTGKLHDAKHIAMRIVQGGASGSIGGGGGGGGGFGERQVLQALKAGQDNRNRTLINNRILDSAHPVTGHTLLHLAAFMGLDLLCQKLVSIAPSTASLHVRDRNGYTPLDYAKLKQNHTIIRTLLHRPLLNHYSPCISPYHHLIVNAHQNTLVLVH